MMSSRVKVLMLSLLAVFAVGAVASASASALLWWVCLAKANGKYETNKCNSEGAKKEYEKQLLPLGVQLKITSKGGTQLLKVAAIPLEISCKTVKDEGWIENNTAASNGIDQATKIEYLECVVLHHSTCKVKSPGLPVGKITLKNIPTKLVTNSGVMGDQFGETGATFVKLELGETENGAGELETACGVLPLEATVTGKVVGKVEASGKLNFTEPAQTGSALEVNGFAAEYVGVVENEMEGGGLIEARNEL
jgi:hypothetical protein